MSAPRALYFLDRPIEVLFDAPPAREKTPDCPSGFIWEGKTYRVIEMLSSWSDFTRRGRAARNTPAQNRRPSRPDGLAARTGCWVRPSHAEAAASRGSLNVGRFYFRVRVDTGQVFDLYYDRAMKNVDDRKGQWFVYRELSL